MVNSNILSEKELVEKKTSLDKVKFGVKSDWKIKGFGITITGSANQILIKCYNKRGRNQNK